MYAQFVEMAFFNPRQSLFQCAFDSVDSAAITVIRDRRKSTQGLGRHFPKAESASVRKASW